ncbi:MAG: response regulator [Pseudomonadales bacterium]|nr:response regulator [Pseudomonadales bacterium]
MESTLVYVVDADPAIRDSLTTLLDLNGYEVRAFATGESFLATLHEDTDALCIVCEAQLPDASGLEIYRQLARLKIDIPFALLISRRNDSIVATARQCGISWLFLKPLVYRHLLDFVGDLSG